MPFYPDQLERLVEIPQFPKRIISLVPSQTELLFDLGLDAEVVGITKFCIHPQEWFKTKTRVGGTKQLHLEKIRELQPDLIIANKEENVQGQIEELAKDFPVWISDVTGLNNALEMIRSIGAITNKTEEATKIVDQVTQNFSLLKPSHHPLSTCYLIWREPYMTIGGDTFINEMLNRAGFQNIFAGETRYPELTIAQLQAADCELLLLSSEPYPFAKKHMEELQPALPDTKIMLVDGEMFSWYGSRLLKAPAYFQQLQIAAFSVF
jgi:ABC-type Fe3+-hydroxamate transport system substrate-binding protein